MTLTLLIELFRLISHDQLYAEPPNESVVGIVRQLPGDSHVYVGIANEAFNTLLLGRDEPDFDQFQRAIDIFTILLYRDGRTFEALLWVASLAHDHPAYGIYGVNALAALANYMRQGRPLPVAKQELVRTFRTFEDNDDLTHNAGECLKVLRVAYR